MSDSVRQAVAKVNNELGLVDKKTISTAAKFAAMASTVAATAGGLAIAFIKSGNDYIRAMNGVSAQTGITGDELKEFGDIAREVYKSGKGENFQEIADALVNIRQASGLAGEELKVATNSAMLLKDTFGMEVNETTRAATALMKNFGISAEEAYGIIAVGAQNGANKNDDLLDTLNEYSVHYKALGLDADQFITSLIKGAEAGSFSIDKVGDAVKEFNIRAKDGSKTSTEGFAALGLEAETMTKAFAAGGDAAQAAFFQTIKALNEMKDPVEKNAAGVALFGTQWEDLEAGVLNTLASMSDASVDAAEALRKMEEVKYNDIGYAITQISRTFGDALIPAAEKAGQIIYKHMPQIQANIERITPSITALGESFAEALPGIIDFIASAANEAAYFSGLIINNWSTIGPVVYAVAGAFAGFKLYSFAQSAWAATAAIRATTVALMAKGKVLAIDKAETLYLQALYAKDAIIRGVSTAATYAQIAATTAWNAVCAISTGLTTALGAAIAFLTSPIGIAIAAIAAIIAIGVLLYQNWGTVMAYAGQLGAYISGVWNSISYGCSAMCSSITGAFSAAFSSIPAMLQGPINSAISLINSAINAINGIGVTIPDWVPGVGGQSFSANIPNIPTFAKGGFTNGISIAGEAGQEAVISFDPAHRQANIGYLQEAAARLGLNADLLNNNTLAKGGFIDGLSIANNKEFLNSLNLANSGGQEAVISFDPAHRQANIGYLQEAVKRLGINANAIDLPMFAKGGFTNGLSIAGEAGQEAVISFNPAYRQANIGYLQEAAARLGVTDDMSVNYYADKLADMGAESLTTSGTTITYNLGGLVFSPTVTVAGGDTEKESIIEQLRNYHGELLELIEELLQEKEAGNYGTGGVF